MREPSKYNQVNIKKFKPNKEILELDNESFYNDEDGIE